MMPIAPRIVQLIQDNFFEEIFFHAAATCASISHSPTLITIFPRACPVSL
jgi:hypothetical protein